MARSSIAESTPRPLKAKGLDQRGSITDHRIYGSIADRRIYVVTYPSDQGSGNGYSTYDIPTWSRSIEGYSVCHRLSYISTYHVRPRVGQWIFDLSSLSYPNTSDTTRLSDFTMEIKGAKYLRRPPPLKAKDLDQCGWLTCRLNFD